MQEFTSIGRSAPRVDFRAKLLGEAVYGYDARLPDMGYGAYAVPPRFGAELLDAQPGDAAGMPGCSRSSSTCPPDSRAWSPTRGPGPGPR
ncbi:hypothetical protein ACFQY4_27875 [Catellatospora bangladeshensis]|uniref:hypothetical protein n=1 Tax=Catellatospora bangladeshensis TaxID=310355 RepID=UPI00361DBD60